MRGFLRTLVAIGLALAATGASAQPYPSKPITIVVPFAAGSGTDSITRIIGQYLSAALNQSVVIENKVGASGVLAATYVARAAPDGYTLLMATNSTHSANPHLFKSLAYDPVKDFAPVARAGSYVFMLVVNPDIPAKTLPELVAHAKANPGKLTYASGNTTGIVAGETLKSKAGIDVLHIPYKSTPPAHQRRARRPRLDDVHRSGARASSTCAPARCARSPSPRRSAARCCPTCPRCTKPASRATTSPHGPALFAPAGTPKEIVARLNAEVQQDHRQSGGEGAHRGHRLRRVLRAAGDARRVRAVRAGELGQADQGRRHRAAISRQVQPAFSPVLPISRVPSASARRVCAEPGRSGFCWLSCGAQPESQIISKVARILPSRIGEALRVDLAPCASASRAAAACGGARRAHWWRPCGAVRPSG